MDHCYREPLRERPPRRVHDRRGRPPPQFEAARRKVARFVNATDGAEIVFTRNATEAINLVAYSWARANLREPATPIVLTHMEHHANVVPWQMLAAERGVELRWIPLTADFRLDLTDLDALLDGAKLLAISAMSNVLGTINDIRPLADAAHAARRARARRRLPVRPARRRPTCRPGTPTSSRSPRTRCCGPSGIGALWARAELLDAMPPFLGGGEMIRDVRLDGFTHQRAAVEVRGGHARRSPRPSASAPRSTTSTALGMDAVRAHEMQLTGYALDAPRATASTTASRSTARATSRCAAARSRSCSTASTPTTSARSSTRTASACGPATTAPSP